ncbi:uncharacterized protein G2W53_029254 [Senna tora]|uniref:Uncharacterized protein n=1 Tax=Senna tora TaxID=362788 RepID=A0A834W9H4_9FABA|nr:uncharacterized protein G2W53_029254 [Senna tora]
MLTKPSLTKNPRSPHKQIPSSLLLSFHISKTVMRLKAQYFPALSSSITLADTSGAIFDDVTKLHPSCAMNSSLPSPLPLPPALPMSCFDFLALQAIPAVVLPTYPWLQMATQKATDVAAHAASKVVKVTSGQTRTFADGFSRLASKKLVCASHRHKEMAAVKSQSCAYTGRFILHRALKTPLSSCSPPPPSPTPHLPSSPDRHPVARIFICDEDASEVTYSELLISSLVSSPPSDEVFIVRFVDMKAQHFSSSMSSLPSDELFIVRFVDMKAQH